MNWKKRFLEKVNKINSLKQERGSILVLTVILLPIMFAFLGFAFDFGNIYMHKARLQNVADAAALAGARAYLNSQATENKDGIDGTVNRASGKLKEGSPVADEYRGGRSPEVYNVRDTQKTKNRNDSKHIAADRAADEYIYHNIANLGNEVKSDRWSHYAINSDNTNPKTFYRVGLYEEVPLYFLPIIQSIGKTQTVRAGAIAVVEKGTGDSGGGGTTTIKNSSIFDNLFTYSEYFDAGLANENSVQKATYEGNMVFTYGNGQSTEEHFYDIEKVLNQSGDQYPLSQRTVEHLFTDPTVDLIELKNNPNSGGYVKVNDPIINTYFNTTAYVQAFKNKLMQPHYDHISTDENLNISGNPDGTNSICQTKYQYNGSWYRKDGDFYYRLNSDGTDATFEENGKVYKILYRGFSNEKVVLCGHNDDDTKYYLLNQNGRISNCYFDIEPNAWGGQDERRRIDLIENGTTTKAFLGLLWNGQFAYNKENPYYFPDNNIVTTQLLKDGIALATPINNNSFVADNVDNTGHQTNVYHVAKGLHTNQNLTINVQSNLGDSNTPIYVIVDDHIEHLQINIKNNTRPIILVSFGTVNVLINNNGVSYSDYAKLTIYAPYGTAGISPDIEQLNFDGTFYGNVIARKIAVKASGGTGNSQEQTNNKWIKTNYLADDEDIKIVDKAIEDSIKNSTKLPDSIMSQIMDTYANALNIDKSAMSDPLFYSKLRYYDKQALYAAWKQLVKDFPEYKNQLWPWNEHFDVQGEPVATDGTLRLINYLTDYLDNGQANAVVDPFLFLSLEKPDAY